MPAADLEQLLPLAALSYQLLVSLAEADNHGYGLMKDVRERTGARMTPATGTVYLALQRLEDDGLIDDSRRTPRAGEDQRRRYYRITPLGRRVAGAEAKRLLTLVQQAADVSLIPETSLASGSPNTRSR